MENLFIEFKAVDKHGEKPYVFNRDSINYFRPYYTKDSNTQTAIYLKGSDKPVIIPIVHESVKRKLDKTAEISEALYSLSSEELKELVRQIKEKQSNLVPE